MAIQVRRGKKKDFDPDKMLPGEWAGTTDTKEVFFAFAPGDTKKMATYEDMEENIREATGEITAGLTEGVNTAIQQAETAAQNADQAVGNMEQTITQLVQETGTAVEQAETAAQTANTAAQDAQDAAQEAREAAENIGTTAGVMSIKGDAEAEYRSGDKINLTPADLGALSLTGDAQNNTVTFTSNDSGPDGDHAVLEVEKLTTGETFTSILQKSSRMFTNIRYLLRLAGTTDISAISDGTLTGTVTALHTSEQEIKTALIEAGKNTAVNLTISTTYFVQGGSNYVEKKGNCARLQLDISLNKEMTAWSAAVVTTIPAGYRPTRAVTQYFRLNNIDAMISINTDGKVSLQSFQSAICNFIKVSMLYLI